MKWMYVMLLGLGALATVPAARAAAPCAKPRLPVQRVLCADAALRRMDVVLQALQPSVPAHARSRPSVRDAALWRADRDDVLWTMLRRGSAREDVVRVAWALTRSRMDDLLGRRDEDADLDEPLPRLARAMRTQAPVAGADVLDAWRQADATVQMARGAPMAQTPPEQAFAAAGLRLSPTLRAQVRQLGEGSSKLTLHWLAASRVGAVAGVQGTADCAYRVWFRADVDGLASPIAAPMLDQSPCSANGERVALLRVGNDTYAALERPAGVDGEDVSLQWWTGERWASPQRLRVRFDHSLSLTRLRCVEADCAAYRRAIMRAVARYDGSPQAGRLPPAQGAEKSSVRRMLKLARHAPGEVMNTAPFADGLALDHFCDEATYFTLRVQGRLLLGRIGHGHLGWRVDRGWLVGLWVEQGGRLRPVAGAVVARPPGRVLGIAVMPPAVVPTR